MGGASISGGQTGRELRRAGYSLVSWGRLSRGSKDQHSRHPPLLSSTAPSCALGLTFENFKEEKMPHQDGCRRVRMEGEPVPPVCRRLVGASVHGSHAGARGLPWLFLTDENFGPRQGPEPLSSSWL